MKSFKIMAAMVIGAATLFTACDKDMDHNPTLQTPPTFTLNTPAYDTSVIDLATSSTIDFAWSQPDYGFPLQAEYQLQASTSDTWTTSVDQAEADETGATKATYGLIGDATTAVTNSVNAADLAKVLEQLEGYEEDAVPEAQSVYVRVASTVGGKTIYSNTVTVYVAPYYYELKDAAPDIWYLIGGDIADGSWGEDLGTKIIPLYPIAGNEYDKKTGTGVFSWTGYLAGNGFKLKHSPKSWDEQVGMGGSFGEWAYNDGGSADIKVPAAGYYTVTLDNTGKTPVMTVEEYTGTVNTYPQMLIAGDFNGWSTETQMNASFTFDGAVNHDWYFDVDASAGATTAKFLTDSSWGTNWGSETFPYGTGVGNGKNIPVSQGSYRVMFNDITGQYYFLEK